MALVFQLTQDSKEIMRISKESGKSLNHLHSCLSDIKTRANESLTSIVEADKLSNGQSKWKLLSNIHVHSPLILSGHSCNLFFQGKAVPSDDLLDDDSSSEEETEPETKKLKNNTWVTNLLYFGIHRMTEMKPVIGSERHWLQYTLTSLITRKKELDNFTFKLGFLICTTWISSLV